MALDHANDQYGHEWNADLQRGLGCGFQMLAPSAYHYRRQHSMFQPVNIDSEQPFNMSRMPWMMAGCGFSMARRYPYGMPQKHDACCHPAIRNQENRRGESISTTGGYPTTLRFSFGRMPTKTLPKTALSHAVVWRRPQAPTASRGT